MIAKTSWTSSSEMGATVAPTCGAPCTSPSDCRSCSASRMGMALTWSWRPISSMTRRWPGASSPRMMAPRRDW